MIKGVFRSDYEYNNNYFNNFEITPKHALIVVGEFRHDEIRFKGPKKTRKNKSKIRWIWAQISQGSNNHWGNLV